jgi:hypothetical protein
MKASPCRHIKDKTGDRHSTVVPEISLCFSPPSQFIFAPGRDRLGYLGMYGTVSLGKVLKEARELGISSLLVRCEERLPEILGEIAATQSFKITAIVPNMPAFIRMVSAYGTFGAGWRIFLDSGISTKIFLLRYGFRNLIPLLRKSFPSLLSALVGAELHRLRHLRPPVVYLDSYVCDLLLAFEQIHAFRTLQAFVRKEVGAELGLQTRNMGFLLEALRSSGLDIDYLYGPLHTDGYLMRPDQCSCAELIARSQRSIGAELVQDLRILDVVHEREYWLRQGVRWVGIPILEPEDLQILRHCVRGGDPTLMPAQPPTATTLSRSTGTTARR